MTTGVRLEEVTVRFGNQVAVRSVSLEARPGRWLSLLGPNGAGKTTLLRAIAGLEGHEGRLWLGDDRSDRMPARARARLIALVPQRPVVPEGMTVTDYVLIGRTPYIPYLGSETQRDLRIAGEVLARLELEDMAGRALGTLSGGELQRVVLARALAQQAPILLLDEPTSALDIGHQQQILGLVDTLRVHHRLTVIAAMHDLSLAGRFGQDLVMMHEGRVVSSGEATTVLTEGNISAYFGAEVRVFADEDGIHVLHRRPRAAARQDS